MSQRLSETAFKKQVIDLAHAYHWGCYSIPDSRYATLAGWPDLSLIRTTGKPRLVFAELKGEDGRVSKQQETVLGMLKAIAAVNDSIEVYVWRPRDWEEIQTTLRF